MQFNLHQLGCYGRSERWCGILGARSCRFPPLHWLVLLILISYTSNWMSLSLGLPIYTVETKMFHTFKCCWEDQIIFLSLLKGFVNYEVYTNVRLWSQFAGFESFCILLNDVSLSGPLFWKQVITISCNFCEGETSQWHMSVLKQGLTQSQLNRYLLPINIIHCLLLLLWFPTFPSTFCGVSGLHQAIFSDNP